MRIFRAVVPAKSALLSVAKGGSRREADRPPAGALRINLV